MKFTRIADAEEIFYFKIMVPLRSALFVLLNSCFASHLYFRISSGLLFRLTYHCLPHSGSKKPFIPDVTDRFFPTAGSVCWFSMQISLGDLRRSFSVLDFLLRLTCGRRKMPRGQDEPTVALTLNMHEVKFHSDPPLSNSWSLLWLETVIFWWRELNYYFFLI